MIVRMEPVTAIIIAIVLSWAWGSIVDDGPICMVKQEQNGVEMYKPIPCLKVEGEK